MRTVVFYFQVHQPFRLRRYTFFDIGRRHDYFFDEANRNLVRRVAEKCYLPMNRVLLEAIERGEGAFRCSFSISGTALDQFESWAPEVLDSFQELSATGCVELLAETSHHSLASLVDDDEFELQVESHRSRIERLFGRRPTLFRNTELVCSNAIARRVENLGFRGMLAEGADHLLGWRSPHRVYRAEGCDRLKLLLRSYRLSDDIAFRFSNREWDAWPLSADRYADWLTHLAEGEDLVGLFMDYETFGEHQWSDTGIFEFMRWLPVEALARGLRFATPSEVVTGFDPVARIDLPYPVSWADAERDLTAWLGNQMQKAAFDALWGIGREVRETGDADLLADWRRLTTSDHLYYMCTKWFSDGDVHKYFSPFSSPHDGYIAFMNVLDDVVWRVRRHQGRSADSTSTAERSA